LTPTRRCASLLPLFAAVPPPLLRSASLGSAMHMHRPLVGQGMGRLPRPGENSTGSLLPPSPLGEQPRDPMTRAATHTHAPSAVHAGHRHARDSDAEQHRDQLHDGSAGGAHAARLPPRRAAPAAATHALLARLQEAFCQEAPTSPICPGGSPQYEYVEDRPGETAPLSLPRMPAPRV